MASQRAPHGRVLGFGTALHERGADESGARGTVCRGLQEHESIRVTGIDVVLPQQRRLLVSFMAFLLEMPFLFAISLRRYNGNTWLVPSALRRWRSLSYEADNFRLGSKLLAVSSNHLALLQVAPN